MYCNKHRPDSSFIDVKHKLCVEEGCKTRASFGRLGFSPKYCSYHKKNGMIQNSIRRCELCVPSKIASKTKNKIYFCDDCAPDDSEYISNVCSICLTSKINDDEIMCEECKNSSLTNKTIKEKWKELSVKQKIIENNINISLYDKVIPEGCSKKRPDFIIDTDWGHIIIEVDEFQHNKKSYSCECEIIRMKQIYFDIGIEYGKVLFIRYNPDTYKQSYGSIFTTNEKLDSLIRTIKKYQKNEIDNYLEVLYLFYDGYSQLEPEIDIINPYD